MKNQASKKFLEDVEVLDNIQLASCIWKLTLKSSRASKAIMPGQFVHLQVDGGKMAMLRRPFSVFNAEPSSDQIEIVYEIKGKGTRAMASWKKGDVTSIIAPLGNCWQSSFSQEIDFNDKNVLLVGGGVGAAPLYMLARNLTHASARVDVVLGARTKELLVLKDNYAALSLNTLTCATDDGTFGYSGFCTRPALELLNSKLYDYVATCGPAPVMKEVALSAKGKVKHVEVSMEERMACGVGACKTCVVNTTGGKVKSCESGPIFPAEVILW